MVTDLPEQLIAQAEFLRDTTSNEANLRRAICTLYYSKTDHSSNSLHGQFAVAGHIFGIEFGLERKLLRVQREDNFPIFGGQLQIVF